VSAAADDEAFERRRRQKNVAVALTVAGFCLLFFLITIVRMGMR
jgi:hypothetical protein